MRPTTPLLVALALLVMGAAISRATPRPTAPDLSVILADRSADTLAAYGLFTDAAATTPAQGVIPYELAVPLFSDGASKHRYVFLPSGARVQFKTEGAFEFPVGTVLIKTFAFVTDQSAPGVERAIETRLLIRKRNGWSADTYVWNADRSVARLQVAGAQLTMTASGREISYLIPNRNQCKGCHAVDGALTPIGPSAEHLGLRLTDAPSELDRWRERGILEGATTAARPLLSSTEARARAYLDINCAHCHNPKGPANTSGLDLRMGETDPSHWGVRKRPIAAGRASADMSFAIEPGRPERSILLHRMESDDPGVMMPELGRSTVDRGGVELVRRWITEMDAEGRPRQN